MSNDGPKKTIMGWQSPLATPGQPAPGQPAPGQPAPQAPAPQQWQQPPAPQAPPEQQWQQPPAPQAPPAQQWQQPQQPPQQQWQQPQQPPQQQWQQPQQPPQQQWQQPPQQPQAPQQFGGQPQGQFGGGNMGGMPIPFGAPPQQPQQPQGLGGFGGGGAPGMQGMQGGPPGMQAHGGAQPSYDGRPIPGADATQGVNPRLTFIRLTYLHLFGAILLFAGLEFLLMRNETVIKHVSIPILKFAIGGGRYNWLAFLGLFMVVGYIADYWARHTTSKALQYAGLGLYVIAEACIFLPLLVLAEVKGMEIAAKQGGAEVHIIRDSAYLTLALFTALTASVFITKKDFSFMRSGLAMGGMAAMVLIVISIIGGFNLGIIFSFFMVALAAGYVLYYTSQVLAHYHPGQHVAASLALFSAIALMFWYVIRIMMKLRE